jgi:hypothetical protein
MTIYLKQSTSAVVSFGPFVAPADGVTLVTTLVSALDNGSTGIFLAKNGGTLTIRHATVTATTYDAYGNYKVTLDTTDTGTLGAMRMQFAAAASCLPVWQDFMVVPANVWDSLFGASVLQVALSAAERNSAADAILDRDMSTGTDSGSPSVRTVRQALRFLRNKWQISAGTLTVYKENDSTSSWTSTLTGTAGADPITTSDPA